MAEPFDPIEVDDVFREKLLATLDEMETFEPDIDEDEEEYYEWEDRINILHDLIDAIDSQLGDIL